MSLIPSPSKPASARRRTRALILGTAVGVFVLGAVLLAGVAVYGWARFSEDADVARTLSEGGRTKVLLREFREHFHGRTNYAAVSLEELRRQGVISEASWNFLRERGYSYRPFSAESPAEDFVLRLGWPVVGDSFSKGDLVGGSGR